jgi:hypothetical protein
MGSVLTSFLEGEYAKSPVRVMQCSQPQWRKVCRSQGIHFGQGYGGYYFDVSLFGVTANTIFVDASLPNYQRLAVFYHELTHAECWRRGCKCFSKQHSVSGLCEHHAQLGAMLKCNKSGAMASLSFAMMAASRLAASRAAGEPEVGARLTVKHPFWSVCRGRIGERMYRAAVGHGSLFRPSPTVARAA